MLTLALVGCGGMGCRHIRGLAKLRGIDEQRFRLVAAVDIFGANATNAANLAEELLAERPQTFAGVEDMHQAIGVVDAMIVTTAPDSHADVGIDAMASGINVMVEKPIALTVRQGIALIEAAESSGKKLAVAENYRRDPINRLAKALIDAGVLHQIYLAVQSSSGSGEKVIITPWRHKKQSGGIVVDMGIHYADLFEYFLGPVDQVFGFNAIVDKLRVGTDGALHEVDAEDFSAGVARFASGAIANYMVDLAGRGKGHFTRLVQGRGGSLSIPHDRSGKPLELMLRRDGADVEITPEQQLALVPDFALDDVTAKLFGGHRLASYDLPFVDIDSGLLAIEQADFADAITNDRAPEVDGMGGLRALAIAYGFMEAEQLGRPVGVESLLKGEDSPYQNELLAASRPS
jgi:predicted dehydrogenase